MADHRAQRGLPERLALPPAPRDEPGASRWAELSFDRRRMLARLRPDEVDALDPEVREVVAGLQRARLATRWRLLAAAPALGWLVLMTFWGFGRSAYPEAEGTWLLVGLLLGAVAWFVSALAAAARLRRARATLAATQQVTEDGTRDEDRRGDGSEDRGTGSDHGT